MKTLINPPGTEQDYDEWQMSDAVRVGDTIWLSGKVGINQSGNFEIRCRPTITKGFSTYTR